MVQRIRTYQDFMPFADRVLGRHVGRVSIVVGKSEFERAVREEPRLVIVANHGPWHLPLVGMCAVGRCMVEHGGAHRKPLTIVFRFFYRIPGVRQYFARLAQLPAPLRFDGILQHFETNHFTDLCIAPEGQNSVFGAPGDIREFTSPRFVELAAHLEAPILLAVGVGMEPWARAIPLPDFSLVAPVVRKISYTLADALDQETTFCLPVSMKKIPELYYGFELHRPRLTLDQLQTLHARERHAAVAEEAARLHMAMERLRDRVREAIATSRPSTSGPSLAP